MSTYTPIATQTLTSTASSVTLSSIPQGYTDLVLVVAGKNSSSTYSPYIQFNGDTSTNYSITSLYGDGSNAASARASNTATAYFGSLGATQVNAIVQIQNYSNTTTYKTALIRINAADFRVYASVMLWRSTAAITSLTVFNESPGTFASATTFSLYGIAAGSTKAQGGIVTNDGTYYYHTFLSSGVFTPYQALTCDYLVVAGGGSKGYGAGGGAGGLLSSVTATGGGGTLQSALSVTAQPYSIIVGAGGPSMTNGSNSIFSTVTSIGGGKGGDFATNGSTGGSGGGGGVSNSGTTTGGAGTVNQGYAGGTNGGFSSSPYGSGGGGGAGAVGGNAASASINGNGGVGLQLTAWATSTNTGANSGYYAGGGGGDSYLSGNTAGTGGLGGGGAGGGNSGTNNTGGGGGGNNNSLQTLGGSGGSGIVIVRYAI